MQKYINQLLEDLKAAHNNQPSQVDYKLLYPDHPAADPQYEGTLDYIIEWENAPRWKMDDLFGISVEVFPPTEKLNETQLVQGIRQLWQAFNIYAEVPETKPPIPISKMYKNLINYWKNEEIGYVSEGMTHIEFCSYEVSSCPWGEEFCQCKDYPYYDDDLDRNKFEKNNEPDALPF